MKQDKILHVICGVKEWCDMRTDGNKWDWWDFACTCIGAALVALLIIGMHFGKG